MPNVSEGEVMGDSREEDFDREVRRGIYDFTEREGLPPTVSQAASELPRGADEIAASLRRLAEAHVLVLQRDSDEILMLPPYSAVPTPFVVESEGRTYFANCVWDALGVPAMLKRDAEIKTSCGCCGASMNMSIANDVLAMADGVVHFALPAARWWDDLVFT
ncbi:MAG: alkylmercury lyase family protein [Acidobacteria bacterium]|nr:alkylmercury lyase family protein [Acidobacteriota bacterium]MCA1641038.1 alkylmercury lyase family protein [Acidobacteriota bacterium]